MFLLERCHILQYDIAYTVALLTFQGHSENLSSFAADAFICEGIKAKKEYSSSRVRQTKHLNHMISKLLTSGWLKKRLDV